GVRPLVVDALAPANGGREASSAAAGEPGGGDPDASDEAVQPRPCCDRHDGAAESGDVPDRCQAAQPGARTAGATGEGARREPAPILSAGRRTAPAQAPATRPRATATTRPPDPTYSSTLLRAPPP